MQEVQNEKMEEEEEEDDLLSLSEKLIRKHQLPLSAQSAFCYVPPRRKDPPELSYFQRDSKHQKDGVAFLPKYTAIPVFEWCAQNILSRQEGVISFYDCIFKKPMGYDQKLHRCDREHAKSRGLYVNEEEKARSVPVLSSSEYGKRIDKPVDELIRDYVHINHVKTEFYRKNGIACMTEKSSRSVDIM